MDKGSLFATTVRCPKCGHAMWVSDIKEYAYQCFDCDEDFEKCLMWVYNS